MQYTFSVPEKWYDNVYKDKKECCSAARSFSLLHEERPDEVWLLLHGYRGYPGELVHPAEDLYNAGFDVFVPRQPGNGTSGSDFMRTTLDDWLGFAKNALADLKERYKKVHILGHSAGAAIAAVIAESEGGVGKLVYAAPGFSNRQMDKKAMRKLRFLAPFKGKVRCPWRPDSRYRMHYENAPCDDLYLGGEYWSFYFTKQLLALDKLQNMAVESLKREKHESLMIYPILDSIISEPSAQVYADALGDKANIVRIENGTHCVFYDREPSAEEAAVEAVIRFSKGEI